MRRVCIFKVSHNQQCMQSTHGSKEGLCVHFQGQEGIDTVEYFRKMIETQFKLNLAVYSKMVGGSDFLDYSSWRYKILQVGLEKEICGGQIEKQWENLGMWSYTNL